MRAVRAAACAAALLIHPAAASGQAAPSRFDAGGQMAMVSSSEFDAVDLGGGGRVAWHATRLLGLEAELNLYPGDFPRRPPFSGRRVEGLFGMTARLEGNRVRPFARVRPGFVRVGEAPRPFACIRIFPPPLSCSLASGRTLLAFDLGGGVELGITPRTFLRIDAGDRMLRYPGPAFAPDRMIRQHAFVSHEFRLAAGAGLRF